MRRWDEVWRRFVSVVQSGLASMATDTAEEMLATRGVSHFDNIFPSFFSSTHVCTSHVFCCRDIVAQQALLDCCLCFFSYSLFAMILAMRWY